MIDNLAIEQKIGYKFKDKKLLEVAFTHPSYANEHKTKSNQRLEFLGDAVLELIVTDKLFSTYVGSEGDLTKYRASLVSQPTLAFIIEQLGLEDYLQKGKGESRNGIDSKGIKCDLFEAIVGAIYLDGGYAEAQKFVLGLLQDAISNISDATDKNYKSLLQEKLKNQKIVYRTTKKGEDHNPTYTCTVLVNGINCGKGIGGSKKVAEQAAAREAFRASFRG